MMIETPLSFHIQKSILVVFYLLMMHMVHQDNLDQYMGQKLLNITHIQVEGAISVPFQWCWKNSLA